MKPFLGINLTENKNNNQFNGDEFLVAKPSLALAQSYERSSENANETIEKSKLPLPLRICQWICGITALLFSAGLFRAYGQNGTSFEQAYKNAPWIFWIGGGCLLVWLVLKILGSKKQKSILETEESSQSFANLEKNCDAIYSELSIPSDSKEVDILSFYYKEKEDGIKVCEKAMQLSSHFNSIFNIFADSENLYIANLEGKYAFPLTSIKTIHTINKRVRLSNWNKDEQLNSDIYKPYKLVADKFGCVHCKYYHIIEVDLNGESWGIHIPCYELPIFEKLTGIKATEQQ